MCLGAIYWARPDRFFFASTRADANASGFDDAFIYDQINLAPEERTIPGQELLREYGRSAFLEWNQSMAKVLY
jgi:tRNA(Arg) A34 adenosine deaminase TadA